MRKVLDYTNFVVISHVQLIKMGFSKCVDVDVDTRPLDLEITGRGT